MGCLGAPAHCLKTMGTSVSGYNVEEIDLIRDRDNMGAAKRSLNILWLQFEIIHLLSGSSAEVHNFKTLELYSMFVITFFLSMQRLPIAPRAGFPSVALFKTKFVHNRSYY